MLKKLCAIRLRLFLNALSGSGKRRRGMGALYGFLVIYCAAVFGFLFGMLFWSLLPLTEGELTWLYFALAGILAVGLSFAGSVFMTERQLYDAQDNQLLLSLPIPPGAVLGSRMLVLYLYDLFLGALVLIPAAIVGRQSGALFFPALAAMAVVPLLALSLSCIFGWLIGLLTARMRHRNLFSVVLTLLFLAGYLLLYTRANAAIQAILTNRQAVAQAVRGFLYPFYLFGMGMAGAWEMLLLFFLGTALLFALVCWILSRTFVRIATAPKQVVRRAWRARELCAGSVDRALVKKELERFFGSSVYLLNAGIGALLMVIAAAALVIKRDDVRALAEQMAGMSPDLLPAMAVLALCFCSGMVDLTASSVSMEGKNLWLLKSLPVMPWDIFRAKLSAHLLVCLPPLLLGALAVLWVLRPAPAMGAAVVLMPLAFAVCNGAAGLVINLRLPKLDWDSETQAVKQSAASMVAVLGGMGITVLLAVPCFVLAGRMNFAAYFSAWTVLFLLLTMFCLLWLKKRGAACWEAL